MDTLTHTVLGACIGEVLAGKKLGKKAMLIGAIANNLPDIDFVAGWWLPVSGDLVAHRGFTHSFVFTILITPLLAFVSHRLQGKNGMAFRQWALFWGIQIFIHQFIDSFNAYGTGWFIPFSKERISFNTMYVADPLYSIWLAIATIALVTLSMRSPKRKVWVYFGLGLSTLYWLLGIAFKLNIDNKVKDNLQGKHVAQGRYFTTPTPLNNLLWYVVAESDSGYYVGYRSVLDKQDKIDFHYAPKNETLLQPYRGRQDMKDLLQFASGYYAAAMWHDTLVFNVLRFGEMNGWAEQHPRFTFYYYLQYPDDNKLVVQRGRFAKWDKQTFTNFLRRIEGNQ